MKYPKIVNEQVKEIAQYCNIEHQDTLEYIRKALFITYLQGRIDVNAEYLKELKK